jgi:bifunctional ADP-heptose synthase (sugar kinase/adenylyltransferase)
VDEVVGKEVVEAYGGQVCVVGALDGISTTRIIESATDQVRPQPADSSLDERQKAA